MSGELPSDPIKMKAHMLDSLAYARVDDVDPVTANKVRQVAERIETMTTAELRDLNLNAVWHDVMTDALQAVQGDSDE